MNDSDAKLADGQHCASHRLRPQRARIDVGPFDKKIWMTTGAAQPSNLRPESCSDDREVQVLDALALDDRRPGDVITDGQLPDFGRYAEPSQGDAQAALPLATVDDQRLQHIRKCQPAAGVRLVAVQARQR